MSGLFDLIDEWKSRTDTPMKGATNPALIESAMKNPDYGMSSATPGFNTAKMGQGLAALGQSIGGSFGEQEAMPEIQKLAVMQADDWNRRQQAEGATIAQSSRKVKTPGGLASVQAGDPISENGSHIAAIQQLKREIEAARKRVAALKARKGRK
jgi:hypothetical protein